MANLTKAIMLAAQYHEGQTDKGGNPYVFHPLRLMLKAYGETEQIVAVLHDTIEDTDLTLPLLREAGFSETIVEAVDALSRRKKEAYEDFILRIKDNPLARRVKVYDLQDNMDLTRIKKRTAKDKERLKKYSRALDVLLGGDLPEKGDKVGKDEKPVKTVKADKPDKADKKAKKALAEQMEQAEETAPLAEERSTLPPKPTADEQPGTETQAKTESPPETEVALANVEADVQPVAQTAVETPATDPAAETMMEKPAAETAAAGKPARKPRAPRPRKPALAEAKEESATEAIAESKPVPKPKPKPTSRAKTATDTAKARTAKPRAKAPAAAETQPASVGLTESEPQADAGAAPEAAATSSGNE